MMEIEFYYRGNIIAIQGNLDEKMEEIVKRFKFKANKTNDSLYFLYGGNLIKKELTLIEQINKEDIKKNKAVILVSEDKDNDNEIFGKLVKSKYIICPECKENARILINDYKITLYDCKNGHEMKKYIITRFCKNTKCR